MKSSIAFLFYIWVLGSSCSRLRRSDSKCPTGERSVEAKENSGCFRDDLNHAKAYPGNCQQYLYCHPFDCTWHRDECNATQYWNDVKGECVKAADASCAEALFGNEAVVQIENVAYGKILDDDRSWGYNYDEWEHETPIIGFRRKENVTWNQVLIAKRRDGNEYYSLAFNKGEGNHVKVVTVLPGGDNVVAKMFDTSNARRAQWRFLPVPGKKDIFRIISVSTDKALTMFKIEGQEEYMIRVLKLDTELELEAQEWIVRKLNVTHGDNGQTKTHLKLNNDENNPALITIARLLLSEN